MSDDIRDVMLRLKNAVDILDLRVKPNGMDVLPGIGSTDLCKMILLDGATALDYFSEATP